MLPLTELNWFKFISWVDVKSSVKWTQLEVTSPINWKYSVDSTDAHWFTDVTVRIPFSFSQFNDFFICHKELTAVADAAGATLHQTACEAALTDHVKL